MIKSIKDKEFVLFGTTETLTMSKLLITIRGE
jgi:hypothetical protein